MLKGSEQARTTNGWLSLTSGISDQCEMPFRRSGMCAGYNQSKRKEYIFRLKKLTEKLKKQQIEITVASESKLPFQKSHKY